MSEWVHSRQLARQCITGDVIRQKAVRLQEKINYSRIEDSKLDMKFTVGWLSKFQKRWNLRSRRMDAESGDADMESVRDCLTSLASLVQSYHPNDVWSAEETGLYYQMPPDRTINGRFGGQGKKEGRLLSVSEGVGAEVYFGAVFRR